MRHKDVRLCPIGALAFFLGFRFNRTKELEKLSIDDWLVNSAWFDIKLLTDPFGNGGRLDNTKSINSSTYSDAMHKVLDKHNIPSNHWLHLGRTLGPKLLERSQISSDEIRQLGNWELKIQELCYSTKLPMRPIRSIAGFEANEGMHLNPRVRVRPPEALLKKTPFWFAYPVLEEVLKRIQDLDRCENKKFTVYQFLRCMRELAVIFLQDAAVMLAMYGSKEKENRGAHPLFRLPCFKCKEFDDFQSEVMKAVTDTPDVVDYTVEMAIPSLKSTLLDFSGAVKSNTRCMDEMRKENKELADRIGSLERAVVRSSNVASSANKDLGSHLIALGQRLKGENSSQKKSGGTSVSTIDRLLPPNNESEELNEKRKRLEEDKVPKGSLSRERTLGVPSPRVASFLDVRLPDTFGCLRDVLACWKGKGMFKGRIVGVAGGVEELEREFKARWRSKFTSSETKHFNRFKRIATIYSKTNEEKKLEYEKVYGGPCKRSLSLFERYLGENGVLKKGKPRGKTAAKKAREGKENAEERTGEDSGEIVGV